ncbi:MAG TPA: hypothetical protein PLW44_11960, partial [Chitinophagales bacterium]|nr:hypothetical protein [Chitinophagales bacterium]
MLATEFQKLIAQSQPHSVFKNDWEMFYPDDFAQTLLPDVPCYVANALEIYDGADLFAGLQKATSEFYQVTDSNKQICLYVYTYPKGVLAGERKSAVQPDSNSICVFVELTEDESISVFFSMGTNFKSFIDNYFQENKLPDSSLKVCNTEYKTDTEKFKAFFSPGANHYKVMSFIFKTIGIDPPQTLQNDYNAKLLRLLEANKIESFSYRNIIKVNGSVQYVTISSKPGKKELEYTIAISDTIPRNQPEQYVAINKPDGTPSVMFASKMQPVTETLQQGSTIDGFVPSNQLLEQVYTALNTVGFNETSGGTQKQPGKQTNQQANSPQGQSIGNTPPNQQSNKQGQQGVGNTLLDIAQKVALQLDNPFYSSVKVLVKIKQEVSTANIQTGKQGPKPVDSIGNSGTLMAQGMPTTTTAIIGDINNYDVEIDVYINANGEVKIQHKANPDYLKDFVAKWQQEAKARGLEIDVEELRKQVLFDFESSETEDGFYNAFIKKVNAALSDKIASYTEGIQATQKVGKNIWSEGVINQSLWFSKDSEHGQWPRYMKTPPAVGGALDAGIDEIVGIPMAIKSVYEIATDEKQRAQFAAVFTTDGFKSLVQGVAESVKEDLKEPEKVEYQLASAGIQVTISIIATGGYSYMMELLNKAEDVLGVVVNPEVLILIKRVKQGDKYSPALAKAMKEFLEKIDPKVLNNLVNAEGFEDALKEMAYSWKHFNGGKFVLDYAGKMVGEGKAVKFAVSSLDGDAARVYDIVYETVDETGKTITKNLELKNWKNFIPGVIRTQFVKDLNNMSSLGSHKWIFSKKGINQDIDVLRGNVVKALKK